MSVPPPVEKVRKTVIPLPTHFKNYLVARKNLFWLVTFAIWGLAIYWRFAVHHERSSMAFLRSIEKRGNWRYVLDTNYFHHRHSIALINFGLGFWEWHTLVLSRSDANCRRIEDVRQARWQNLPALCIELDAKHFWSRKTLWMVYAPEDEERVKAQVLPLLEEFRRRDR
ncbi:MAG: hypothetical protein JO250_05225 [Armatimonadetes bacterium]|nr:hypothetical protein [Armatimonadota bacterium]